MLDNSLTKNCHSESPSSRGQAYFRIYFLLRLIKSINHKTFE